MNYKDVVEVYSNMKLLLPDCHPSQLIYRLRNLVIFIADHFDEISANNPEYIHDFFEENERYYKQYPDEFDERSSDYMKHYIRLLNMCITP